MGSGNLRSPKKGEAANVGPGDSEIANGWPLRLPNVGEKEVVMRR